MKTRGEARRQQILEAAEEVFGRDGYWGATTDSVAKLAGVTQPAIYRYFDSKYELFVATLALRQKVINSAYGEVLESGAPPLERLRRIARALIELNVRYPHMARLRLQAAAVAATHEELRPAVHGLLAFMHGMLRQLIVEAAEEARPAAGFDPDEAAQTLVAQGFYFYLGLGVGHESAQAERAIASLEHTIHLMLGVDERELVSTPRVVGQERG